MRGQNGGNGLVAIFNDPSLAESSQGQSPFASLGSNIILILTTLVGFVVGPLIAGAVAKAVATSYLGGQITAGEALRGVAAPVRVLFASSILVHLTEGVGLLGCCVGACS